MKVFSMSQRIYYKDLEPDAELIIKKDLELYNCMLHKAFKICFNRAYKDATYSETDQRMIKSSLRFYLSKICHLWRMDIQWISC